MNTSGSSRADSSKDRVYLDYYNLEEPPFAITPDPEYLFYSVTHRNAIDKLLYGIESRMGFLLLVGEVGTGKTTICRSLLDNLAEKAATVYIINPSLSGTELISSILDDLGIDYSEGASKKELIDILNQFLLSQDDDLPVVIVIDDAQTMHVEALEDMRLLSNLETDKQKLLQILLVGQPELLVQLSKPEMRQLKQRVALTCRLDFLSKSEIEGYISRRLFISGDKGHVRFKTDAIRRVFTISKGIPRLINRICDYALTAGYVADTHDINQTHVNKALKELKDLGDNSTHVPAHVTSKRRWLIIIALISLLYSGIVVVVWHVAPIYFAPEPKTQVAQPPAPKPFPVDMAQKTASQIGTSLEVIKPPMEPIKELDTSVQETNPISDITKDTYVIRIASFKTMERIEKAATQLKKKGISSYWKLVDLGKRGKWYGIYTGRFETLEEAKQFRERNELYDAIIEHRYPEK